MPEQNCYHTKITAIERFLNSLLGDDECEEDDFLEKEVFVRSTGIAEKPRGIEKFFGQTIFSNKTKLYFPGKIEIYDATGKVVGNEREIKNLPGGVYFIKTHNRTIKIIKTN